jgi:SNF2 family DNA or RNA helicase
MVARIDFRDGAYVGLGTFDERLIWKNGGFEWDGVLKAWVAPALDVALRIPGVTWTQVAQDEAAKGIKTLENSFDLSFRGSTDFDPPCPEGLAFRQFQKAGIEYALMRDDTLIGDQPGLGKTVQAIGVANADEDLNQTIVIVPASLKENWRREWEKWSTTGLSVGIAETQHQVREPAGFYKTGKKAGLPKTRIVETIAAFWPGTDVVIINYDILDRFPQIKEIAWDYVVVDECHALKSEDSYRTLHIIGGYKAGDRKKKRVAETFEGIKAKRRVFLSGTPMLNRPIEFWPICKVFDPKVLGRDKTTFQYRYCGGYTMPAGPGRTKVWDLGATNKAELGERLRQSFMVRRLKRNVLPELPAKTRIVVPLDSKEIRELVAREDQLSQYLRLYEQMVADKADPAATEALQGHQASERLAALNIPNALGDDGEVEPNWHNMDMRYAQAVLGLDPPMVQVAFEEIALVRREIGMAKLTCVVPWAKDFLEGGEKLLLFAYHTDVVEALIEALAEYEPAYVYGKVPLKKRQPMVDRFQDDPKCRVFVGQMQAAGVGFTLTAAHDVAFAELDWTPSKLEQCEDRVCRIGQTADKIFVYYLVANGSLDSRIAQSAKAKEDDIVETLG